MAEQKDGSVDHPPDTEDCFDEDGYCTVCGYGWWRHTWKHIIFCHAQTTATDIQGVEEQ